MSIECLTIEEIERLATSAALDGIADVEFLRHMQECLRCRYLWTKLIESDQRGGPERIIVLQSSREPQVIHDELLSISLMAADSLTPEEPGLEEIAMLVSEPDCAYLRIVSDASKDEISFYLSLEDWRKEACRVFLPGLVEPVLLDDYGIATIPARELEPEPDFAILVLS